MASRLASLLALLGLAAGPAVAQAPPAGTGTIFMGWNFGTHHRR